METNNQELQAMFIEFPSEFSDPAAPLDPGSIAAQIAHSRENISHWRSYLPEECIVTMIEMGWDITT